MRKLAYGCIVLLVLAHVALAHAVAGTDDDFDKFQKRLQLALDAGGPIGISDAVTALAETGDPRAVRPLVIVGGHHPEDPIRTAVAKALVSHDEPTWIAALGDQLAAAKSDTVAILTIQALATIDHPATAEPLVLALHAVRSNVVVTALRAASRKRERVLVPACIEVLAASEKDSGLVWAEARIALQTITGERFLIADDWQKWFQSRPPEWIPRASKGGEDRAKTSVYRPDEGSGSGLPRIFGQEIASKRVVFVIDTSQSMEEIDPTTGEEGSSTGARRTRLQRAQRELIKAIEDLRPEVQFNVIAYSTQVTPWIPDKLVTAKNSFKRKAMEFVGALKPEGYTNTGEALLTAMDLPEVDTIIFLSDGSPTIPGQGSIAEIPPIIEAIVVANRTKKITIHTLGFTGSLVSFMRAIAAKTGGTYAGIR